MTAGRRVEIFIFLAAFLTFAWFNQGGGWNQNARFAEVRAMVEQGRFAIDSFLVYERAEGPVLARIPVENGDIVRGEKTERLAWMGADENLAPVNGLVPNEKDQNITLVPVTNVACSGDMAFARGHFHPNKPPGSSLVAAPGYFIIHRIEKWFRWNPDHWRVLAVNAWLTSALSVGLISSWGCVIFFRLAKLFAPEQPRAALWATITFAFGTLFFPFATLLFDHDLTATFLLAAFYWIFSSKNKPHRSRSLYLSGFAAGLAAITNYVAAVAVAILGLYLLTTRRRDFRLMMRSAAIFAAGVFGPFLFICVYNKICYGSPFALSNDFQNPVFKDEGPTFLGMFGMPQPDAAAAILFSPFRGLFYGSPVLLLGVYGLLNIRKQGWSAEFWLIVAMFTLFFTVNITFFGWHAGFSSGPRYLIPAIPFLALPMVFGFIRFPKTSAALASLSIAFNLLLTAVDAESPVGIGQIAYVFDRPQWMQSPLTDYAAPLFFEGRAWPLINELIEEYLQNERGERLPKNLPPAESGWQRQREELHAVAERGEPEPILLATIRGPVSVNPIGVDEGSYYHLFPAGSPETRWNSCNAGELLFPESRWSLAPLVAAIALLVALAHRATKTPLR